jgi:lipoic acid synthetase
MAERKRRNVLVEGEKLRGYDKVRRIPVKVIPTTELPSKPDWIRVKIPASPKISHIKQKLREHKLASVCEEASCPNLGECFSNGTATFMIMGDICTRRCPFCDVAHGKPRELDVNEPRELAEAIKEMGLSYVVITSVDRDDLKDSGAQHFADCITQTRYFNPETQVEVLVPDFRGRMDIALDILQQTPPDVFNHNLETVPRMYRQARPGADYQWSLDLLKAYKARCPECRDQVRLNVGIG